MICMKRPTIEKLKTIWARTRQSLQWHRFLVLLSAIVVFVTTYALILPAITIEQENADESAGFHLEDPTGTAGERGVQDQVEPTDPTAAPEADPTANTETAATDATDPAAPTDPTQDPTVLTIDPNAPSDPNGATVIIPTDPIKVQQGDVLLVMRL